MDSIIEIVQEEATEACFEFVMQNMTVESFVKKAFQYVEIHQFHKESANSFVLDETLTLLEALKNLEKLGGIREQIKKEIASQNIEKIKENLKD